MPTVMRIGSLRVVVYPNDHAPAHAHVLGGGAEAIFWLDCPVGPVRLRENRGFGRAELARIRAALDSPGVVERLCGAWRAIHGGT